MWQRPCGRMHFHGPPFLTLALGPFWRAWVLLYWKSSEKPRVLVLTSQIFYIPKSGSCVFIPVPHLRPFHPLTQMSPSQVHSQG